MRAVVQRVREASVQVGSEVVGQIGPGLLVLVGVAETDGPSDVRWMAEKLTGLRIFEDEAGKANLSVLDTRGGVLLVSQFTLLGDARQGKRPSFTAAARPDVARGLFEQLVAEVRSRVALVATGRFREHMEVSLVNDGPFTMLLDSTKLF